MTYRELLIGIAIGALALAALALAFATRAIVRRVRAGRPRMWRGLWLRGVVIAGLLAVGVASLLNAPPPQPQIVNRPAPAAADATIAFLKTTSRTVVGVSARDGVTRWTRTLTGDGAVESLLRPAPDIIIAVTPYQRVTALRAADGAILWDYHSSAYLNLVTVDGARVVAVTLPAGGVGTIEVIALSLATGALAWRVALPASVRQAQRLAVGDGQVFVEGWTPGTGTAPATWVVMALRAADGAPQWTTVEPAVAGRDFLVQALFIMQGYVVVVPDNGPVTALRESDGVIAWTATPNLEEPDNPSQNIAVTTDSDTIYMVWEPSHWATGANGRPIPPPVSMAAMAIGGTIRWHMNVQPGSSAWSSLTVSDGVLLSGNSVTAERAYGGYNPNGSLLSAYDAASGRPLWRDNMPPTGVSWDMSPQISPWGGSGAVYLMGLQADPSIQARFSCIILCRPGVSWLYAVNIHTGAPWWRIRMGNTDLARPFFVF